MTNNITTLIEQVICNLREIELDKNAGAVQLLLHEYQKLQKRVNDSMQQLGEL
jgi:hypothetical protein